ncbi:indolepyruvate oxidoreductase subunit beta [Coprothermobacteraceae bacterium]|nr:indolepyruvate oxidoreductase subunit beta [Coprothermobacteraceae bacterium]
MVFNIVLSGVGGQGILTAAKIIGRAAVHEGHYAAVGEIHGLAQRGGSVIGFVRISDEEVSSTVPEASADLLVAFEPLEAIRYVNYAKKGTKFVINTSPIVPVSANLGNVVYPSVEGIREQLQSFGPVSAFDALEIAKEIGNPIYVNTIMLGKASQLLSELVSRDSVERAIRESISRDLENNMAAFDRGYSL